jgi:putative Holliday junction resolvase
VSAAGRILGLDFGTVRVGLAVTDPDRKFSFPLEIYQRRSAEKDAEYFRELVKREEIARVVVGLPVHLSGTEGQKAREARAFACWLTRVTGITLVFWDERFTTVEAESALWNAGLTHQKRKERRDKVAAQILLQAYLDAGCPEQSSFGALDAPEEPANSDD